jgi:4-amino-4-deoxy-L-arabinose transferase-like glycosyltransferase
MRLAAVVLLGLALRLVRLTDLGDLEFDEIVSVRYAALPAYDLLPRLMAALFEHPPAYYVALGWWRALVGPDPTDTLARFFSVVPGTLTVALAYAVGRRLDRHSTGLVAALLVALAPLLIFYSREVRMYAWVSCLTLASFWLYLRGLARPRRMGLWFAYALVVSLAAYVHYSGLLLALAYAAAAIVLRRSHPRAVAPALAASGVVLVLVLPWALVAQGARASLPAFAGRNLAPVPAGLWDAWRDLSAGPDAPAIAAILGGASLLLVALLGLAQRRAAWVAIGATVGAGLLALVVALAAGKPVQPRYLLPIAPLVCVCAAIGMCRSRGLAMGGALALFVSAVPFWSHYYVDYRRADYSDVTRKIVGLERHGDYVLLTGPWQAWYFDYYYPRQGGRLFHAVLPPNAPPPLEPAAASAQLADIAVRHERLWFVQAGLAQADPTNFVERWLRLHAWPVFRQAHQNAVLSLYTTQPPASQRPVTTVRFGDLLEIAGGWIDGDDVHAGDALRLSLDLRLLTPASADLKASLRLVGVDGQRTAVDFDLVDRSGADVPTSGWPVGRVVAMQRGIWVPAAFSPQPYDVRLVVYDGTTLQPLAASVVEQTGAAPPLAGQPSQAQLSCREAGCEVAIATVSVTQSLAALAPGIDAPIEPVLPIDRAGQPASINLAGIRWHQRVPGDRPLELDLLWRLDQRTPAERSSILAVERDGKQRWYTEERPIFAGTFNVQDWRPGETLGERRAVDVSTLPPGRYRLLVGLQDGSGGQLAVNGHQGLVPIAEFELPYRKPLDERLRSALGRLGQLGRTS